MRCLLVLACLAVAAPARADAPPSVALLPLDAEARLEIYGQPVAAEIARALTAGDVKVVVVKQNMTVPGEARLIIDGSIKPKGALIALQLRVREAKDGTVVERLDSSVPNVGEIDRAAADLSARLLPLVREQLAKPVEVKQPNGRPPVRNDLPRPPPPEPMLLVAIGVAPDTTAVSEPLRVALVESSDGWARANRRLPSAVELTTLLPQLAADTVSKASAERAIAFEIVDYWVHAGEVPIARARVRVRIADATGVTFDRVIATDSVVGDRNIAPQLLAGRVAREVLAILRPHMRRMEPAWR